MTVPARRVRVSLLLAANCTGGVLALWAAGVIPPVQRDGPPMLLIAHRGDTANSPAGSLAAIVDARDRGADGIEFDVRASADGTWWVFHDQIVDHLTDGTGPLEGLSDAEIAGLEFLASGEPLTRLDQVVDALRDYEGWIYVDLKSVNPNLASQFMNQLQPLGNVRVICMSVQMAAAIKQLDASMEVLALSRTKGQDQSPHIDAWLANEIEITRPDVVVLAGRPVDAFVDPGVEDLEAILQRLSRFGVRAVISDALEAPG